MKVSSADTATDTGEKQQAAPVINLTKGGGTIGGMGEKFAANPVTATRRCCFSWKS